MKPNLVLTCQKTFLHTSRVPLLNWRRPETCKTKPKQFHLPRTFLQENHATCRSKTRKKNVCLVSVVPCDMQKKRTCSGVLSSSTNCGQNGLCQFFAVHTGCCPVDIIHPCMPFTLAPTKTPCEQIAKTS